MTGVAEKIFSTPRFDVMHQPLGGKDFYFVQKPDSVISVVSDDHAQYAMIRSERVNVHGRSWELPGGRIESGETPSEAILREVQEELSINIDKVRLREIGSTLPLPSVTTERAHIFEISTSDDLMSIAGARDGSHEGISAVYILTRQEIKQKLVDGSISCAVDAFALFLALEKKENAHND